MARWDRRIRRRLRIGIEDLKEGVYLDEAYFDDFVSWLRAKDFKEAESDNPAEQGFSSPDEKWFVHFRRSQGFVFIQLRNFLRARLGK
ncbi:MAG: hypothetical protein O7E52_20305 [Candidatus Poribacteria bacterium]|nr:hypothetical protein [Candidatus Poribacteria bacterium]